MITAAGGWGGARRTGGTSAWHLLEGYRVSGSTRAILIEVLVAPAAA